MTPDLDALCERLDEWANAYPSSHKPGATMREAAEAITRLRAKLVVSDEMVGAFGLINMATPYVTSQMWQADARKWLDDNHHIITAALEQPDADPPRGGDVG